MPVSRPNGDRAAAQEDADLAPEPPEGGDHMPN